MFIRTRSEEEELLLVAAEEGQGGQRGASQAPAGLVLPEGLRMEVLINTSHVSALSSSSSLRSHTAGRFRCQPAGVCGRSPYPDERRRNIHKQRNPSVFFWCFQMKSQTGRNLSNDLVFLLLLNYQTFHFFGGKINPRCGSDTIPILWLSAP